MSKPKADSFKFVGVILMAALIAFLFLFPYAAASLENKDCSQSSLCGNITIDYPFRLKSQPKCNNTDNRVELECDNGNRTILVFDEWMFHVKDIFYSNSTIRLVHPSLDGNNCSVPRNRTFIPTSPYYSFINGDYYDLCLNQSRPEFDLIDHSIMYLVNCSRPVNSSLYVDTSRCINSSSHLPSYLYFLDQRTPWHDFHPSCTVIDEIYIQVESIKGLSTSDIYEKLLLGLEYSWEIDNYTCWYLDEYDKVSRVHVM